ncbi:MAG: hydantoinase B/oxoprolinase family protein [Chloroflexi bacterium]|nr:hydantoinase B/oxoprolinase family protein [Chloroflexota bacterium]
MVDVDPITLELVLEGMIAVVREVRAYFWRASYSVTIYEGQDYSCALLDGNGLLVAKASEDHVLHTFPVTYTTRLIKEQYAGRIAPGDIFIHNDPYTGGTHLNDIAFIRPVFLDDTLAFFVCVRAHSEDVGGMSPGSLSGNATEIYQEGVRIPLVKLVDAGRLNDVALELLLANVRLPHRTRGDFRAQIGASELGERKVHALAAKYGRDTVLACSERLLQRSEARMRQAISAIPDGSYEYEFHLENSGGSPEPVRCRVSLIVSDDTLTVDFTGSSPFARGPTNTGPAMAPMMVFTCLKSLLDRGGLINTGAMAPVTVKLPDPCYLNAKRPTACGGMAEATFSVSTAMLGALASMLPERAVGDLKGAGNNYYIGGKDLTGEPFIFYEYPAGGTGGFNGGDGNSGCRHFLEGDFGSIQPVEVLENEFPVFMEHSILRVDSGGPGTFRGGLGLERRVMVPIEDATLSYITDKITIPPFGVVGGGSGGPNAFGVVRDGAESDPAPVPGKVTGYRLQPGDVVFSRSAGGGGYGDPLEREPQAVLRDVLYGYVSERGARDDYGVVLRDGAVAEDATRETRARLRSSRREVVLVHTDRPTDIRGRHVCYVGPQTIVALGIRPGDAIEISHYEGAPLRLWVEEGDVHPEEVAIDDRAFKVLRAQPGDRRFVQRPRRAAS